MEKSVRLNGDGITLMSISGRDINKVVIDLMNSVGVVIVSSEDQYEAAIKMSLLFKEAFPEIDWAAENRRKAEKIMEVLKDIFKESEEMRTNVHRNRLRNQEAV